MEFEECEISGHMVADGNKGQYWVMDEGWTYLERVTPTPAGPKVEKLGTFDDMDEAMIEADRIDRMGLSDG